MPAWLVHLNFWTSKSRGEKLEVLPKDKIDISHSVRKNKIFISLWPCQFLCGEICNILIKKGYNHQHNDGVVRSVVKVGRKTWSDLTHTLINRLKNRNFFQKHKLVSSISIWDQQQKYQSKCSHYQGKLNHIWEKYERFYKFVFVLNFVFFTDPSSSSRDIYVLMYFIR